MARVALIWELGADLGHISRLLAVALALREQGHECTLVLRDISRAWPLLQPHDLPFLQAPIWLPAVRGLPPEANFGETLFRFGFLDPNGLSSLIAAWRGVVGQIRPDLLVFDHAPSALLGTRGLGLPRLVIGNSFAVPPRVAPWPAYRWWLPQEPHQGRLQAGERRLVEHANQALARFGAPLLTHAHDLYDVDATLVCARAPLDVYGPRTNARYVGPANNLTLGEPPAWPAGAGPKVFAYLKAGYTHVEAVLRSLAAAPVRSLVYAPGLAHDLVQRMQTPTLRLSPQPVQMAQVRLQADLGVCHAGGVTDVMLEAGKPLLLLPMQMEQTMTARRADALGAALHLPADGDPAQLPQLLARLLHEPSFGERARAYAQAVQPAQPAPLDVPTALPHIVAACTDLLAGVRPL